MGAATITSTHEGNIPFTLVVLMRIIVMACPVKQAVVCH